MDNRRFKVVFVVPKFQYRDEELDVTRAILEEECVETVIASTERGECLGMLGGNVCVDMVLSEVNTPEYDAAIFIGGDGCISLWNDSIAQKIAITALDYDKLCCGIGSSPVIFANAGVLIGKRVSVWKNEHRLVEGRGAYYTGSRVTYDGNIITAEGPECADQFARSIYKGLKTL